MGVPPVGVRLKRCHKWTCVVHEKSYRGMGVPPVRNRLKQTNMDLTLASTDFETYCRHLPHWRANHIIYFVTWRLDRGITPLEPEERTLIASAIEFFDNKRYWLFAYVVMDDHVHVLLRVSPDYPLQKVIHSWKSYTSHQLGSLSGRIGQVWQQEYFDRIVRDKTEFENILAYIAYNPTKRWPETKEYPWVKILINMVS
jgi:putative transposase